MGTNYYGRKKINYPLNFTNITKIEDLHKAQNEIENLLKKIHLGKISNRNFIAQWNSGNFYNNKQEYLEFIKTLDIKDEYGRAVKFDEFLRSTSLDSDEGLELLEGDWF